MIVAVFAGTIRYADAAAQVRNRVPQQFLVGAGAAPDNARTVTFWPLRFGSCCPLNSAPWDVRRPGTMLLRTICRHDARSLTI